MVIDQAGATGLVAEKFRQAIANPDLRLELGSVATARQDRVGSRLGDLDPNCPGQWADKRLVSLEDLARGSDAPAVFSGLQTGPAAEYEDRIAKGRLVVTNASANRMRPDVALVNTFVNSGLIDELYWQDLPGRIIAGGNCLSTIICTPLAPIHSEIGITRMQAETLQGWSGTGARGVPEGVDEVTPIGGDEASKIESEPRKLLGKSMQEAADILISAQPKRGPWLRGHHAVIAAQLARGTSRAELEELWRQFRAPEALGAVKQELKAISQTERVNWPRKHQAIKPVKLVYGELVRYDTRPMRLTGVYPMRVKAHIKDFGQHDPGRIVLEAAGDNLMLGAVGGNLLNLIYARARGYLG